MSMFEEGDYLLDPGFWEGFSPEDLAFLEEMFPGITTGDFDLPSLGAETPFNSDPIEVPDPSERDPVIGQEPSPYEGDPRADNPLFQGGEGGTGMRFYMPGGQLPGSGNSGSTNTRGGSTSSSNPLSALADAVKSGDWGTVLTSLLPLLLGAGGAIYGANQRGKATDQVVDAVNKSSEEMKGIINPQMDKYNPFITGGTQAFNTLLNAPPSNLSSRYQPLYRLSSLKG